jgi:hypothetical protein
LVETTWLPLEAVRLGLKLRRTVAKKGRISLAVGSVFKEMSPLHGAEIIAFSMSFMVVIAMQKK